MFYWYHWLLLVMAIYTFFMATMWFDENYEKWKKGKP